jgi:hypothetical protein
MDNAESPVTSGGTSILILCVSIVGILGTALLLLSYYLFLTRCGLLFFWRSHVDVVHRDHQHQGEEEPRRRRGLQAAAIRRIPTFRYQVSSSRKKSVDVDCAVCLADFRDGERLRQLPSCRHAFHIDCIDAWLQATANCPLCRATVVSQEAAAGQLNVDLNTEAQDDDHRDIIVSSSDDESSSSSEQQQPVSTTMRGRRSLSMDSSTDKRFYRALMLHHQQQDQHPDTPTTRSLRRSFFSFSHSRSATVLPL